jgi:hypothetical protein
MDGFELFFNALRDYLKLMLATAINLRQFHSGYCVVLWAFGIAVIICGYLISTKRSAIF